MNKEIDKFLFIDDENNYMLVLWNRKTFEKEYCKLQNQYRENELERVDFYDELEERLKRKGVTVITDLAIISHKDLCFN